MNHLRFIPCRNRDGAMPFVSADALALHLLRQRPGARLDLLPQIVADGEREFPAVGVFAMKPRAPHAAERARTALTATPGDPPPLQEEWLGWAAGQGGTADELQAAIDRMRSAGGLAA